MKEHVIPYMELNVSIAFIRNHDCLLFQKRKKEPYAGYVGLLGGKVESQESAKDALIREVLEESSLTLTDIVYKGTVLETLNIKGTVIQATMKVFSCQAMGFLIVNTREGNLVWIHRDELADWKDKFIPTDWTIVEQLISGELKLQRISVNLKGDNYEIVNY